MPEGVRKDQAWSSPAGELKQVLDVRAAAVTWLIATTATVVLGLLVAVVVGIVSGATRDAEFPPLGLPILVFAVYLVTLRFRLPHVAEARLYNSVLVGAINILASGVLLAVLIALALAGADVSGPWMFAILSTSAVALVACLLAPSVIPEHGPVPTGTQHEEWDELHRL